MGRDCRCSSLVYASVLLAWPGAAWCQDYPSRPIRIVAVEAGGGADFNARAIGQGLSSALGQPVVVDNRRGTILAAQTAAQANPDGYTLFAIGSSLWLQPFLQDNVPYDPVRDFAPVALTNRAPNVLVVYPGLPVKSVRDLIALAKAKPGVLNYGSGASGASSHLGAELFKQMAGVNIVRIPYKGAGPAISALMGGQVDLMFSGAASAVPHLKSGRLTVLAVASTQPSALFPGFPTVAASGGLPGFESASMQGVFAPARTPSVIITRLNREIDRLLNQPEVKQRFFETGVEIVGGPPELFAKVIKAEMSRLGKMIKEAGIRGN